MTMLERLTAQQAELSRTQASLVAQLARAHARVDELTAQNDKLSRASAPVEPPVTTQDPSSLPALASSGHASAPPHRLQTPNATAPSSSRLVEEPAPVVHQSPTSTIVKKTWAQIAADRRPSINDVSRTTMERLRKGLSMLDIQTPEPKPIALYFRNIKRTRLGQVRKALRQIFTHPWAVLGLSFLGQSVIEIVCHSGLCDQVIAKLRLIGAAHIRNLNVFGDNMKKTSGKDSRARQTANLERAQSRFERLVSTCTNSAAKAWYRKQAETAEARLAQIYQSAHDDETTVSEDSGYESSEVVIPTVPDSSSPALERMEVETPGGSPAAPQQPASSAPAVFDEDIITPAHATSTQAHEAPQTE